MPSPALVGSTGRPFSLNGRPRATSDAIRQSVQTSASATTIYATWTTGSASDTVLTCGVTPGAFNIAAVDAGTQTSVTAHAGIIAGLTPGTHYYCLAMSGGAVVATWEIDTSAALPSTPILTVSPGTETKFTNPAIRGDTFHNCIASDGLTYLTGDDTTGFGATGTAALMFEKFSSELPLTGANVNFMSTYGVLGQPCKLSGIYALDGKLYGALAKQNNASGHPYAQTGGRLIKSQDFGASWANHTAPTTYLTNGAQTSPDNASMWGATGSATMASPSFVMYGPDNGTLGYRVDNADAYVYVISNDGFWDNGNALYLSRVSRAKLPNLLGTDYQWFTGGDGSLDANWSGSFGSAVAIHTNTGKVGYTTMQYLPALNRYLLFTWNYPNPTSTTSISQWLIYEAAHPWGPFTLVNLTTWNPQGFYNPSVLMRSALTASPVAFPLTLLFAGDYVSGGTGPYYALYTCPLTITT